MLFVYSVWIELKLKHAQSVETVFIQVYRVYPVGTSTGQASLEASSPRSSLRQEGSITCDMVLGKAKICTAKFSGRDSEEGGSGAHALDEASLEYAELNRCWYSGRYG